MVAESFDPRRRPGHRPLFPPVPILGMSVVIHPDSICRGEDPVWLLGGCNFCRPATKFGKPEPSGIPPGKPKRGAKPRRHGSCLQTCNAWNVAFNVKQTGKGGSNDPWISHCSRLVRRVCGELDRRAPRNIRPQEPILGPPAGLDAVRSQAIMRAPLRLPAKWTAALMGTRMPAARRQGPRRRGQRHHIFGRHGVLVDMDQGVCGAHGAISAPRQSPARCARASRAARFGSHRGAPGRRARR